MARYKRIRAKGHCVFLTLVSKQRTPIFIRNINFLRAAFLRVQTAMPFSVRAAVVLPDHIHFIMELDGDDTDYSMRVNHIKRNFSMCVPDAIRPLPNQRRRRERGVWQPRFWEHTIRDEKDDRRHVDYIHYNPVKHRLVERVADWPYSSFHNYVKKGLLPKNWGSRVPGSIVGFSPSE